MLIRVTFKWGSAVNNKRYIYIFVSFAVWNITDWVTCSAATGKQTLQQTPHNVAFKFVQFTPWRSKSISKQKMVLFILQIVLLLFRITFIPNWMLLGTGKWLNKPCDSALVNLLFANNKVANYKVADLFSSFALY